MSKWLILDIRLFTLPEPVSITFDVASEEVHEGNAEMNAA
jgi:hypothetical protein